MLLFSLICQALRATVENNPAIPLNDDDTWGAYVSEVHFVLLVFSVILRFFKWCIYYINSFLKFQDSTRLCLKVLNLNSPHHTPSAVFLPYSHQLVTQFASNYISAASPECWELCGSLDNKCEAVSKRLIRIK